MSTIITPASLYTKPFIGEANIITAGNMLGIVNFTNPELCLDWRTDTKAEIAAGNYYFVVDYGTSVQCDYIGVFAHSLGPNGTIQVESGTSSTGPWTSLASKTFTKSECYVGAFTATSSRYWRVWGTAAAAAKIGVIALGKRIDFPTGMPPGFMPPMFNDVETKTNVSANQQVIGRTIVEKPRDLNLDFNMLPDTWVRSTLAPFLENRVFEKPFFFAWDYVRYPNETAWCWTNKVQALPSYTSHKYMSVSIPVKALVSS